MARLTQDEKNLIRRLQDDYEWAKGERDDHTRGWADCRDQYESEWVELSKQEDDEDLDQWFYVPKTFTTVHRIEAELLGHFFPPNGHKLGKITASSPQGLAAMFAPLVDQVVHAKLDLELQPRSIFAEAFNAGLVEGPMVVKAGWSRGGLQLECPPNEHVMWNPNALRARDVDFVIHEKWLTGEQLWQRQQAGIYENVDELLREEDDDVGMDEWRQDMGEPGNPMHRMYKVLEYWGPQQFIGKREEERMHRRGEHQPARDVVITYYKDKVILRQERNTWADLLVNPTPLEKLPFFIGAPLPKRGSVYPYSLTKILKPLQREMNWLRNQRRQAVDMEMTGKMLYDRTKQIDLKALMKARYGGLVGVNGIPDNAVEWMTPRTSTGKMGAEEQVVDSDMRGVSGVTHYHEASTAEGMQKTATGVQAVMSEGDVKMGVLVENTAETLIKPVLRFVTAACLRYVKPREVQKIIGSRTPPPPLSRLGIDDVQIEMASGPHATAKATRIKNLQYALQAYGQLANAAPQVALPQMMRLTEALMPLLGVPGSAAYKPNMGGEKTPAAANQGGMPNYGGQMALAMQGRQQTPEERPQPRGSR